MKTNLFLIILLICGLPAKAQLYTGEVQNRPYTDLRPFHFGVLVGTHVQDLELQNAGPQIVTAEDGTTSETLVTADQDRWDAGFSVGVLGEFRLSTHFQFRVAPTMYFGTRHITFHNMRQNDAEGKPIEQRQDLKTAYFAVPLDLIFAGPRVSNHRPYIMAGLNPMINLNPKDDDYLKLKQYDVCAEVGAGFDFYLPYFKLRPELKFVYSLTNSYDDKHAGKLRDAAMLPYAKSVDKAHSKMVVLTFYFE